MTESLVRPRTHDEILNNYRAPIESALQTAIDRLPETLGRVTRYHFGWCDADGNGSAAGGGKLLRPVLTLLSAAAVGGEASQALPGAVAVELVHNFSLLHDDVMDNDRMRRHRPTAWTVFGSATAILTGDALLSLAFEVLAESSHPSNSEAIRALSRTLGRVVHGQCLDLEFEGRAIVGVNECIDMVAGKTGALLGCACALGAILGNGASDQIMHLREFGEQLGLSFQIADDLLGIQGDPLKTGKPARSDLINRKKSLPVTAALNADGLAATHLRELCDRNGPLKLSEVDLAANLVAASGGFDWAVGRRDQALLEAAQHLKASRAQHPAEAELLALATFAGHRDR